VWLGLKPEENAERHFADACRPWPHGPGPAAFEKVATSPISWIDVGHTPRALEAVTRTFLEFVPERKL